MKKHKIWAFLVLLVLTKSSLASQDEGDKPVVTIECQGITYTFSAYLGSKNLQSLFVKPIYKDRCTLIIQDRPLKIEPNEKMIIKLLTKSKTEENPRLINLVFRRIYLTGTSN